MFEMLLHELECFKSRMGRFLLISYLFFIIICRFTTPVYAVDNYTLQHNNVKLTGKLYINPVGLDGSPYLIDNWQKSNIILENGVIAKDKKVKLNILSNELIFYNEEISKIFVVDKNTVKSFTIFHGLDSMVFKKYSGNEVGFKLKKDDFINILHHDTISFFVKHSASLVKTNDISSKDKIKPKKTYFIQYKNTSFSLRPSYNAVCELFPGKRKEIKQLIKSNRLGRVNDFNLAQLIRLINSDSRLVGSINLNSK